MLRHERDFYLKFVLVLVIFFFVLTYVVVNWSTIGERVGIVAEGSSFFAKTATYKVFNLSQSDVGFDSETYSIEIIVFEQINEIRLENSLEPLKWDPMLAQLARVHSLDMAQHNYINHKNLIGQGVNDRAKLLGIKLTVETKNRIYSGVGENIGFMPKGIVRDVGVLITTEDIASAQVLEWMLSEPHKENILLEDYRFTGIGVAYDGKGNYYLTQDFQ